MFVLPELAIWLLGIYNAYTVAGKINSGELNPNKEVNHRTDYLHGGRLIILVVFISLVVMTAAVIAVFVFQINNNTGTSDSEHAGYYRLGVSVYRTPGPTTSSSVTLENRVP
ncbi:MAG TPA: hypothetical protein VK436_09425 [Methanocella sp.]|nr:hypothetical protein [Methanocella sp.]